MTTEASPPLAIFDTAYFPDIEDRRTAYVSPITAINAEIRRKNVAAAASSGPSLSVDDSSLDPWDDGGEQPTPSPVPPEPRVCRCPQPRSPSRTLCRQCGGRTSALGFAWQPRSSLYASTTSSTRLLDEPHHAVALLQSTPQLRFLSSSSTDLSGAGQSSGSRNLLRQFMPADESEPSSNVDEYQTSLTRERANQAAAGELAKLLWVLSHEMSLEGYAEVESEVFTAVFGLVHASDRQRRMAGLCAVDALLAAPSADEEKKAIKFANTLSNGLRAGNGEYEFLSAVSRALGHMAKRTANVDFVESEVTRALEWLRTERSDRRCVRECFWLMSSTYDSFFSFGRLAACLSLKEFAIHAPTTFHSKTSQSTLGRGGSNEFLDHIFQAIRDPQPIVRACAADALSQCLKILVDRRHLSLTGLLCQVHFAMMEGLKIDPSRKKRSAIAAAEAAQHGSLLVVADMIAYTREFMLPRFEEVCRAVLVFAHHGTKALIRLEVVRLIPRLARRFPKVYGRRYLEQSLMFLIESASTPTPPRVRVDIRPTAFTSIGQLILAMTDENTGQVIGGSDLPTIKILDDPDMPGMGHIVELNRSGIIFEKLNLILSLVRQGLKSGNTGAAAGTLRPALHCAAHLVEALGDLALPYMSDLIDDMFRAGLSNDLIRCLHSIAKCVPEQQSEIEERMLQEVSFCLAGMRNVYDPVVSFRASSLQARAQRNVRVTEAARQDGNAPADAGTETPRIRINRSEDSATVQSLVLSLQTLASFGGMMGRVKASGVVVPLLPFVQDVAAEYLSHPSSEVRRAASLTCCVLLIPPSHENGRTGSYSGVVIEYVLEKLLRVAVADPSAIVRLCVVRALDSRYDSFLCQTHHLQELFLLLQDEAVATRAAGLRLLGRLGAINPAPILPVLRRSLSDLLVELQCGVAGRGREDATRLLVVFLRAKPLQRLIHPVLASLVAALPLDRMAPPRLASASLEALGDLAQATGVALRPWLDEVIPHVLEIMRDQSSASKQRTSLRTLGQIAGSTGYVIRPYLDYPKLLTQATDVLPATKRAPWSLRREVIRTLGILGALDPDRYHAVASVARKGGAVGGAYFEESEVILTGTDGKPLPPEPTAASKLLVVTVAGQKPGVQSGALERRRSQSEVMYHQSEADDEQPAYLTMYEQYAMMAQPVSTLPPAKRLSPVDEEFYPTVAIQALMRIFRDQGLAVHHHMVIQAIMFIFKSLGLGCVPYLRRVVPYMILTVRTCSPSTLREALLKQLATLSLIAREHLRPYIADIFDVVEQFWSTRHLATILSLVSKIAVGVPDEFRRFVPRLIRRLLMTLDELQVADWSAADSGGSLISRGRVESEKLGLIVRSVNNLKSVLGDYLHVLVPAFVKLGDSLASLSMNGDSGLSDGVLIELSTLVYRTISGLLESQKSPPTRLSLAYFADEKFMALKSSENGLPSRVVQPLVRILRDKPPKSPAVGLAMIETLCVSARLIGGSKWSQLYDNVVRDGIRVWQCSFPIAAGSEMPSSSIRVDERLLTCLQLYDEAVEDLLKPASQRARAPSIHRASSHIVVETTHNNWIDVSMIGSNYDYVTDSLDHPVSPLHSSSNVGMQRVNQHNLQRAWDVSQRTSREDWDEWMRRFAIQLLKEAPSPALRATANLAHAYQPLARELFSAAFACCWNELSEPYRVNLVHALETAFVAEDVSPEILQALLNLAEFMEHDPSGGLPIDIPILADLALKCRAYAKALHYREREYNLGSSNTCVESLISINRKLDLPGTCKVGYIFSSPLISSFRRRGCTGCP